MTQDQETQPQEMFQLGEAEAASRMRAFKIRPLTEDEDEAVTEQWKDGTLDSHPYADMVPLMSEDEFAALVQGMLQTGYDASEPITLVLARSGALQVLDGRNRAAAARQAWLAASEQDPLAREDMVPHFRVLMSTSDDEDDTGDLAMLEFVNRRATARRNLAPTQRAALAFTLKGEIAKLCTQQPRAAGKFAAADARAGRSATSAKAAELAGASTRNTERVDSTLTRAEQVLGPERAKEIHQQMLNGSLTARAAERIVLDAEAEARGQDEPEPETEDERQVRMFEEAEQSDWDKDPKSTEDTAFDAHLGQQRGDVEMAERFVSNVVLGDPCPRCGSTDIRHDRVRDHDVCNSCGAHIQGGEVIDQDVPTFIDCPHCRETDTLEVDYTREGREFDNISLAGEVATCTACGKDVRTFHEAFLSDAARPSGRRAIEEWSVMDEGGEFDHLAPKEIWEITKSAIAEVVPFRVAAERMGHQPWGGERGPTTDTRNVESSKDTGSNAKARETKSREPKAKGNDEWYTPPAVLDACRLAAGKGKRVKFAGDINTCVVAQRNVEAEQYWTLVPPTTTEQKNTPGKWMGTFEPGKVKLSGIQWGNVTYSDPAPAATEIMDAYERGDVAQAFLLLNVATDTKIQQRALRLSTARCWFEGRLAFHDETNTPREANRNAQVLYYMGPHTDHFGAHLARFGYCDAIDAEGYIARASAPQPPTGGHGKGPKPTPGKAAKKATAPKATAPKFVADEQAPKKKGPAKKASSKAAPKREPAPKKKGPAKKGPAKKASAAKKAPKKGAKR